MKNTWYVLPIKRRDAILPGLVLILETRTLYFCTAAIARSFVVLTDPFLGVALQNESGGLSCWDAPAVCPNDEGMGVIGSLALELSCGRAASELSYLGFFPHQWRKMHAELKLHNGDALSDLVETFALLCVSQRFYIFYIAYGLSRSKFAYCVCIFCKGKSLFWKCVTMLLLCTCSLILPFHMLNIAAFFQIVSFKVFRADKKAQKSCKMAFGRKMQYMLLSQQQPNFLNFVNDRNQTFFFFV